MNTQYEPFSVICRRASEELFGSLIRERREDRGLTVAEAARLAGMEYSEWAAIEDGCMPADPDRLRPMAASLEMSWNSMAALVVFCHCLVGAAEGGREA